MLMAYALSLHLQKDVIEMFYDEEDALFSVQKICKTGGKPLG